MKEKNQSEQLAAERQVELITEALANARNNDGYWLNTKGKTIPKFYPKGCEVSAFNALVMGLHSDKEGYKTNLYTLFNEAKLRGESVREHERGVPFNWYNWNKYVNRNNPDDIISRKDYKELPSTERTQYKGVHNREVRNLFNIDQTLLPMVDGEAYEKQVNRYGGDTNRSESQSSSKGIHMMVNDFMLKMRENLMPLRRDGSGVAHYDSGKDAVYMPKQENFEHYNEYVQEMLRHVVSATGNQQRLSREGMVMKNGIAPSDDAVKQERLIVELASGVKMMEMGLPARLSEESLNLVDHWNRELKENPCLIDAVESDLNNALDVIRKAENGEKIEYSSYINQKQTEKMQSQLPQHFYISDEISQHPNADTKMVVLIRDKADKSVDVVLPAGASLEVNNEVPGMSKERIKRALEHEGFENVKFFNSSGILGYRPNDSTFDNKEVTIARLRNWNLEDISRIDVTDAVKQAKVIGFDRIQMVQDDDKRWAMYIKPEGRDSFAIYPDKADLNRFFTTLKQAQDNVDSLRLELAQKYYVLSETKPDLKVDLFSSHEEDIDLNRIERVNVFRAKNDVILCDAKISGEADVKPRVVSPSQWQRLWIADDKTEYKKHLAATLFADVLRKGNTLETNANEKQSTDVEQKQQVQETVQKQDENSQKPEKRCALIQWDNLKDKHPDAVILFRIGNDYETYNKDAKKLASCLGIELKDELDPDGQKMKTSSFPYHQLDTYLPKLIRDGNRIALCDFPEPIAEQASEKETDMSEGKDESVEEEEQRSNGIRR